MSQLSKSALKIPSPKMGQKLVRHTGPFPYRSTWWWVGTWVAWGGETTWAIIVSKWHVWHGWHGSGGGGDHREQVACVACPINHETKLIDRSTHHLTNSTKHNLGIVQTNPT